MALRIIVSHLAMTRPDHKLPSLVDPLWLPACLRDLGSEGNLTGRREGSTDTRSGADSDPCFDGAGVGSYEFCSIGWFIDDMLDRCAYDAGFETEDRPKGNA